MLKEIISNSLVAFGCLAILTLIGWLLFVKLYPLNAIQWKKSDFGWLSLSTLGLIGLLAENRIIFGEQDLAQCESRIYVLSRDIQSDLKSQWICMKFQHSEYSPDNLENIQKEFDRVCEWANDVSPQIDSIIENKENIREDLFLISNSVRDEQLKDYVASIKTKVEEYNKYISEKQTINENIHHKEYENLLKFLSPLMLIIGLSIRFTKTLGEISLLKNKKLK